MLLVREKSKKAISGNILMGYMFIMFKRMAIRTKYKQVLNGVIFAVQVVVMNTKNLGVFIISAFHTFFDQAAFPQCFSYATTEAYRKFFFLCFPYTFFRTIYSVLRKSRSKLFLAKQAPHNRFSLKVLPLIIAFSRAIFNLPLSTRFILKIIPTNYTFSVKRFECGHSPAFRGAKFSSIKPVYRNIEFFTASLTINRFPCFWFFAHPEVPLCH